VESVLSVRKRQMKYQGEKDRIAYGVIDKNNGAIADYHNLFLKKQAQSIGFKFFIILAH